MFESNLAIYKRYPVSVLEVTSKLGGVLAALNIGIFIAIYNKKEFERRINTRLRTLYGDH